MKSTTSHRPWLALLHQLPVKLRKTVPVKIDAVLLLVQKGGRILLRQRESTASRMAGFWDLPAADQLPEATQGTRIGEFRHPITHPHYTFSVYAATVSRAGRGYRWFTREQMKSIPCATTAVKALKLAGAAKSHLSHS